MNLANIHFLTLGVLQSGGIYSVESVEQKPLKTLCPEYFQVMDAL